MRRFLQRFPSSIARNLRHSPSNTNPRVIVPSTSRLVFFSSQSDSAQGFKSDEVISKEELKKKIQSFLDDEDEGEDAIPDLFEALLKRKLAGAHDDSDEEVMEEVRKYPVVNNADKINDPNSDIESDTLGDDGASSADLDIQSDGSNDVDLSNLGIKIDGPKPDSSSHFDSDSD